MTQKFTALSHRDACPNAIRLSAFGLYMERAWVCT
jgi:hypothetical protein